MFLVLGLAAASWNISLPLVAYSPGPVSDAADSVVVGGAPTFDATGELILLTALQQDLNLFEAILAGVDPTVDVLARQVVRPPDESDEAYRRRNLQLMDQSTATAISVAFSRLPELAAAQPARVFVTGYAADTPAGEVIEIGDEIVSLAGVEVDGATALSEVLADATPGDDVAIEVVRDDERLAFEVELVESEQELGRPIIGIFVRDLPFWIDIDSGIVGGPSAGMMYTLAIIEVLTEDSLTGGHVVAGTGTVDADGNVGAIGAVRQKVVAAEAAGAEFMLVPASNFPDAMEAPRSTLELVSIGTIDDALEFLSTLDEV